MRPAYACVCMLFGLVVPTLAANSLAVNSGSEMEIAPFHPASPDVTVILEIKGQFPSGAIRQMQREANLIIGSANIVLDWRTVGEATTGNFKDLVVLTFKGSCALDSTPPPQWAPGAYAFTHSADGEVQPFGEVDCDRVANSVKTASAGEDRSNPDLLIGRALGRVVAHELVHMLTKSSEHGHEGVQKASLSGRQLISDSLPLSGLDLDRLKQRYVSRGTDTPAESESR
jgi:hypothetical protein